ncbi:hypothetical protein Zm00014a_027251 [Zea mays]|uniref:Uncharacterized protein n=1 Tax=Zea mays TaxID=4577 RepID=A0A317Y7D0_MAIZE|nr:hypothetical protein Zm00014a_027251 [Zea mays]
MKAAPIAKSRREPPSIPPNYVSLQQLLELRLKEKEEEEKRQREEEAAAARRAAALRAEEAAMAAAVKREAALKAETKGRSVSREAFCGAKDRQHGGQGHQWVAVVHRAPPTCGEVAAGKREWMVGGSCGKKGLDDVADSAPHPRGGRKYPRRKGKRKGNKEGEPGNLAKAAPPTSNDGKVDIKSELKAMGKASVAPLDPAKAAVVSSPGHLTCKGRKGKVAGDRSAETSRGDAPVKVKTAGPSPPRGVKSGNAGKPKPTAPRLADAGTGSDSPDGKAPAPSPAPAPALTPSTSPADGRSKSKSGGMLRKTMEAKPEGLVKGQRRQQVLEVQAVTGPNPRIARWSAQPWSRRGIGAAQPHGLVWVPKAAVAGPSSSGEDK